MLIICVRELNGNLLLDTRISKGYISIGLEMTKKRRTYGTGRKSNFPFGKTNFQFFFGGVAVIILGYVLMWNSEVYSQQALTVATLLLLAGYVVLLPLAVLYKKKESKEKNPDKSTTT